MRVRALLGVLIVSSACAASAQPLYLWTDQQGRVHITDTLPPASAQNVQRKPGSSPAEAQPQMPFELMQAMRDFPVTLYTSPGCKEPCAAARAVLNKRGVPFKEVLVWDEASDEELKRVSGASAVPTLTVGRSVHRGYAQEPYDALLDSARYPRAGLLAPRAQSAPPLPDGYQAP